jgi:hypothetical protein
MSNPEKGKINKIVAKEIPEKNIVEKEQFDKDGNLVCPTCKKSLRGLKTNLSDSLFALDKHTTKKHKVQCCSEECTAKFYEVQQKSLDE